MGAIISRYLCSKTIFVNALAKMVFKQRHLEMIASLGRKNNMMRKSILHLASRDFFFQSDTHSMQSNSQNLCLYFNDFGHCATIFFLINSE